MFLSTKERASKSLRRLTKTKISQPIGQTTSLDLPKKIIKALYDYKASGPNEISFHKGDFFHVIGRENDTEWFEASNPATSIKGIVPVSYFQVIDKTERSIAVNRPPSSSTASTLTSELDSGFSDLSIHGSKKKHQVYGVVMYDFKAERPDELDAQAGEAIVVIAQSNHEWFVAKPIGRLGGPGLIPISFVQVRDVLTGELIDGQRQENDLPGVDDWKKMNQIDEATSLPLGAAGTMPNRQSDSSAESVEDMVDFVSVDSYILEGDQYWFVIYAHVNTNMHRILYRLYEDFYDFQMTLLKAFPVEAGKSDKERILPFMPGPLTVVDEKVTAERQKDLDKYCKDLLELPKYISSCDLVQKQLLGIHEGDIELDYDPRVMKTEEPPQQVKIKIVYKDDIFAIKVPVDCSLYYLKSKVFERIHSDVQLEYRNETTGRNEPLETEEDMEEAFVQAIQKGKLTVIAMI